MKANDFFMVKVTIETERPINITCDFSEYLFFDLSNQIDIEESLLKLKECFKVIKNLKMLTIDYISGSTNNTYSHQLIKSFRMKKSYSGEYEVSRTNTNTFTEWHTTSEDYKKCAAIELKYFISSMNYDFIEELKKATKVA